MRVTPWLRPIYPATTYSESVLVGVDARYVPLVIEDLEARKSLALWESDADFAVGYDAICKLEVSLLMDVKEDIIREVRDLRGSYTTNDTTLAAWPVGTYPGLQLKDLNNSLYNTDGKGVGVLLGEIRDVLLSQGAGEQSELDALLQIVALLSV